MADVDISDGILLGYLDELLPADEASRVEQSLRDSEELQRRAAALLRGRDDGQFTLGDVWRRHRVNCSDRQTLGSYLLGTLDPDELSSIRLHIDDVGCRLCQAELDDLIAARTDTAQIERRQRFFESSMGRSQRD